jgi:hypothetical protein
MTRPNYFLIGAALQLLLFWGLLYRPSSALRAIPTPGRSCIVLPVIFEAAFDYLCED